MCLFATGLLFKTGFVLCVLFATGLNLFLNCLFHTHWVGRGTGTPKDKDEVNKRELCECEG